MLGLKDERKAVLQGGAQLKQRAAQIEQAREQRAPAYDLIEHYPRWFVNCLERKRNVTSQP
jgi:hypothetical protein